MTSISEISKHARFDIIRYAQLWEDGDVLLKGLGAQKDATLLSICAAGDNALAMLLLDPKCVVAIDLSKAQIACLQLRIAAFQSLTHDEFLILAGARQGSNRATLFSKVMEQLPEEQRRFWKEKQQDVLQYGFGGIGKFERFFRMFRTKILPFVQSKTNVETLLTSKSKAARKVFFEQQWNNWRWRLMMKVFFSNFVVGRLGRDPAFFKHVDGKLSDHMTRRLQHALVDTDPSENPYLHWILKGYHGNALPITWRKEHYEYIRARLDRLEIRHGAVENIIQSGQKFDGFNLSDIFEYQSTEAFETLYETILASANKGARLVYWNMMVPRRCPPRFRESVSAISTIEAEGKAMDKAFFYSDFVVEEVRT